MGWKLSEWNNVYSKIVEKPMTDDEIDAAIFWVRNNNYPRPDDCPLADCLDYRPACHLGVCRIAIGMCGDF